MFGSLGDLELILTPKIDFTIFLCYLILRDENQLLSLELILGEVNFFFFLLYVRITFKVITKYKSLYLKINSTKIKSNMLLITSEVYGSCYFLMMILSYSHLERSSCKKKKKVVFLHPLVGCPWPTLTQAELTLELGSPMDPSVDRELKKRKIKGPTCN